jgi:hypothetical protein
LKKKTLWILTMFALSLVLYTIVLSRMENSATIIFGGSEGGFVRTDGINFADTNVTGYINAKRMDYAVQLLKEHPEYTLGAIGEACGIKSPATFIRNFKNTFGMAPSEYRKSMEEGTTTPPHTQN